MYKSRFAGSVGRHMFCLSLYDTRCPEQWYSLHSHQQCLRAAVVQLLTNSLYYPYISYYPSWWMCRCLIVAFIWILCWRRMLSLLFFFFFKNYTLREGLLRSDEKRGVASSFLVQYRWSSIFSEDQLRPVLSQPEQTTPNVAALPLRGQSQGPADHPLAPSLAESGQTSTTAIEGSAGLGGQVWVSPAVESE